MILDTCALLWIAEGESENRLSAQVLNHINKSPVVYVSAISGFEIGLKAKAGKLKLPVTPAEWFDAVLNFHHLQHIDLSHSICLRATELPKIHKDPCDRFIIATALTLDMPVVTSDSRFKEYGVDVVF
ncbi:MAG: type II toxin-antitoxin system VapC family toxin [Proteobacteria bacterium]|nr:type II toxin-antitoxin system VapC family toxin [Pseudomonadota bacterium]